MNHDGKDNHIIGGLSVLLLFSLFAGLLIVLKMLETITEITFNFM